MSKVKAVIAKPFYGVVQEKKQVSKEDFKVLPFLARQASGLSQDDFAKTYCISIGTLQAHEQKKRNPTETFHMYYTLIRKFPVEVAEFVTQVSDKTVSREAIPMYHKLIARFPKEVTALIAQL